MVKRKADVLDSNLSYEIKKKRKIFNELKNKKWREFWEHEFHSWGKHIFDKGKGPSSGPEEGFYDSLVKAYLYISENIGKPLNIQMYLKIHKISTRHFLGTINNTLMHHSQGGMFRGSQDYIGYFTEKKISRIIKDYLEQKYPICIGFKSGFTHIGYNEFSEDKIKNMIERKINQFYECVKDAKPGSDKMLLLILDLYVYLDLLHPFKDGVGRTNIAVFQKLLTEHGFHPVIMTPYDLELMLPERGIQLVKEGLRRWELVNDGYRKLKYPF